MLSCKPQVAEWRPGQQLRFAKCAVRYQRASAGKQQIDATSAGVAPLLPRVLLGGRGVAIAAGRRPLPAAALLRYLQ